MENQEMQEIYRLQARLLELEAENTELRQQAEKYQAFWDQSRLADQQVFEMYVWKGLKEAQDE